MGSVGQAETYATTGAGASPSTAASGPTSGAEGTHQRVDAAGSKAASGAPMTPDLAVAMRAYRNARYHEDREGFFNALNRWSNFVGILLGTAAFAGGAALVPALAMAGGALAAIVSAGRLVFDFSGKARIHGDLRKSFLALLAEAQRSEADTRDLERRMVELYRSEPEVFNAVNAMAYNAAQIAFERPRSTLIAVRPMRAWLRHVFRYEPSDFPDQMAA